MKIALFYKTKSNTL